MKKTLYTVVSILLISIMLFCLLCVRIQYKTTYVLLSGDENLADGDPLAEAIIHNKSLEEAQNIINHSDYSSKNLNIPLGREIYSDTYLSLAVTNNRTDLAQLLLSKGASPNPNYQYSNSIPLYNAMETTPLCIAIKNENIEMVKLLMDYGCLFEKHDIELLMLSISPQTTSKEFIKDLLEINISSEMKDYLRSHFGSEEF